MSTKSVGDGDDGSGAGHVGGSSGGSGAHWGSSGRIAVDTDAMHHGANELAGVAERIHRFARSSEEFVTYAPLIHGEADETWSRFSPSYVEAAAAFSKGSYALAKAVQLISDSVQGMAKYCIAVEEGNALIGKGALGGKGNQEDHTVPGNLLAGHVDSVGSEQPGVTSRAKGARQSTLPPAAP